MIRSKQKILKKPFILTKVQKEKLQFLENLKDFTLKNEDDEEEKSGAQNEDKPEQTIEEKVGERTEEEEKPVEDKPQSEESPDVPMPDPKKEEETEREISKKKDESKEEETEQVEEPAKEEEKEEMTEQRTEVQEEESREKESLQSEQESVSSRQSDEQLEEEEDDLTDSSSEMKQASPEFFESQWDFHSNRRKSRLDDLGKLLKNSVKFRQILDVIREKGGLFNDLEFPPNEKSILGFKNTPSYEGRIENLSWRRSNEYFSENAVVSDSMSPSDIYQGQLGDCYFLAAISALAEHPKRIQRLFLTKKNHGNGLFAVAMCINGVWEEVLVDDYAPCDDSKKLAFNSSKSNELWVVLLEKAWAKVHGGYFNIEAGLTREALRDLTGASVTTFFAKRRPENLWKRIQEAEQRHFVMTAGSDNLSYGSDVHIEKIGLSGSHAYSLLSVYILDEVKDYEGEKVYKLRVSEDEVEGNVHRLVKLRNPWGRGEWTGDWSDADSRWNDQLKEVLGINKTGDDGLFFMAWKDFLKYFSDVQICYYHDDYKYNAEKFESSKDTSVYLKVTIDEPGTYYFSVNQRNKRFYPEEMKYKYSRLGWVAGKKEMNQWKFIESSVRSDKENWKAVECEEGEYMFLINTPWRSQIREFSFSVYGPKFAEMVSVSEDPTFLKSVFASKARENFSRMSKSFENRRHPNTKYVHSSHNGWGYFYLQNGESDHSAEIELIKGDHSSSMKILTHKQNGKITFDVQPGGWDIVVYQKSRKHPGFTNIVSSFNYEQMEDLSVENIKRNRKGYQKMYNGELIDVFVYYLTYDHGIALYYDNTSSDIKFEKTEYLELENAIIEGNKSRVEEYSVSLNPGDGKKVHIMRIDKDKAFKIRHKKMNQSIKKLDLSMMTEEL